MANPRALSLPAESDLTVSHLRAEDTDAPPTMQGRDLAPLYLSETPADWWTDFFYEHPTYLSTDFIPASEALVERDWKFMYWPDFGREQLSDLVNHSREEHDLADDPRQASRLAEMRQRFAIRKTQAP